jgi:hypothetical protein
MNLLMCYDRQTQLLKPESRLDWVYEWVFIHQGTSYMFRPKSAIIRLYKLFFLPIVRECIQMAAGSLRNTTGMPHLKKIWKFISGFQTYL